MRECPEHATRIARVIVDTNKESFYENEEDCNESLYSKDDQDYIESFQTGYMARCVKRTQEIEDGIKDMLARKAKEGKDYETTVKSPFGACLARLYTTPLNITDRNDGGKKQKRGMSAVHTCNT